HGRGLLEQLAALAREPVSLEEMHAWWVSVFELEPAMVDLAHRLSERYRVFLLSNIGDLHWVHLSREHRLQTIGEGALPSYLAGVMKPHAGIYAEAERRLWPRRGRMAAPLRRLFAGGAILPRRGHEAARRHLRRGRAA